MDPFIQVYNDTEQQLQQLQQILNRRPPTASHEEVNEIITDIEETLLDLQNSIRVMKAEQSLPISDILSRQDALTTLETTLAQCKHTVTSQDFEQPLQSHFEQPPSIDDRALQNQLLLEQDSQLDIIHQTMHNLHLQASTMGNELADQGILLNDMDTQFDTVISKLSRGKRQLEWIYENNRERLNDCCIALLIIALIILLVLAFII